MKRSLIMNPFLSQSKGKFKKKALFLFYSFFLILFATAQTTVTVDIPCTGATNPNSGRIEDQSGSYVKSYGYMRSGVSQAWKGWSRFDVPSFVPSNATITAAEVDFYVQTSSGAASSNYMKFFTGNTGTMSASAIWSAIGSSSAHEASSADLNPAGAKTRAINATGVTFLNTNKASILNLGFMRGSGNFGFYIYGADGVGNGNTDITRRPVLRITYTIPCSSAPALTAITGTTTICSGATTTLTATGGTVNTKWFTGSCGGTQVGTGASYTTLALSTATTYHATNDTCGGNTNCVSATVNITPAAVAPTAITGNTTICTGTTTTLTATGGDATTKWFTGSCGGTQVGTGASFTTSALTIATTFYAANEACGTLSSCASTTVSVTPAAVAPTAITGNTTICTGTTTTLTATGGNATTKWFTGSCGGTQVGTGASFTTSALTIATTFYAANEACGILSSCASTTVSVTPAAVAPTAITGNITICTGTTTILTATGGDATTKWFTGSCGGTQVGTGASFTTSSLTTATTFYTANEACGALSSCASTSVSITSTPTPPSSITGPAALCANTSATYSTVNVSGLNYVWMLPSNWSGNSSSNQITATAGSLSGTISVTASNSCGTSSPVTLSVTVNTPPTVALSAFNDVCSSASSFALSGGTPTGGTYMVNGTTATTFSPAGAARTDTITYAYTDGNGCSAAATKLLKVKNCTGIAGEEVEAISLFPNPVNHTLKVKLEKGTYAVVIQNEIGQIVDRFHWEILQHDEKTVNSSLYSSGIYFIHLVEASRGGLVLKFIKE